MDNNTGDSMSHCCHLSLGDCAPNISGVSVHSLGDIMNDVIIDVGGATLSVDSSVV